MNARSGSSRFTRTRGMCAVAIALCTAGAMSTAVSAAPPETNGQDTRRFLVTFKDSVTDSHGVAAEHAARNGAEITFEYSHVIKGYAGTFKGGGLAEVMRDSRVESVELDGEVSEAETQTLPNTDYWGLDRIDQRTPATDLQFSYTNNGTGVTAYILDTGIFYTHDAFGGRASLGFDAVTAGGSGADCKGHGTHVAGIVGGATTGVAKGVTLKSVRVLDCNGSASWSTIIKGLDWVAGNHAAGAPAVANLSLGGSANNTVDKAVNNLIADGVSVVVAAGNGNLIGLAQDACKSSPSRVQAAMTVSATDNTDTKAAFANYGSCVDWFSPGVNIVSSYWLGDLNTAAYVLASGTSMAAPFTAGVAALYLQNNSTASPAQVRTALFAKSTTGVVKQSRSVNSNLLFTDY